MKKIVFVFLFLASSVFADAIDEKIKMLVSSSNYLKHQKLINIVFEKRSQYYIDGELDVLKIVDTLKNNGLLNIFSTTPKNHQATFITSISSPLFMKAMIDILRNMGYNYYLTKSIKSNQKLLSWTIEYNSLASIDPVSLAEKLKSYSITITDIKKDSDSWSYNLASQKVLLEDAKAIVRDAKGTFLLNPAGEYWLTLEDEAKKVVIENRSSNYWYPRVVFFGQSLEILKIYKNESSRDKVTLTVPNGSVYIKVTDIYTPESLKHGIRVWIKGDN